MVSRPVEQPVQSRDAHVVDAVDGGAVELGRDGGLLGDRQVGRPGAHAPRRARAAAGPAATSTVMQRAASWNAARRAERRATASVHVARWCASRARSGPGPAMRSDDRRDLLRRLAGAEDDLGEAPAQGAVVVDLGEAQVLEGQGPRAARAASSGLTLALLHARRAVARRLSGSIDLASAAPVNWMT